MEQRSPIVVGVAGGSGSGKSTIVSMVLDQIEGLKGSVVRIDNYYRDSSHLEPEAQARFNFDHPDALDLDLLVEHLGALREGRGVRMPMYDFKTRGRHWYSEKVFASDFLMVDGILCLHDPRLRDLLSFSVFVDVPADIRVLRRLRRDVYERGRSVDSIVEQYLASVRPMHDCFVQPTAAHADSVVPWVDRDPKVVEKICASIQSLAGQR